MTNQYKLGRTKEERQKILSDIIEYFESGMSIENISKIYGVTKQAVSQKMLKIGYSPTETNRKLKRHKIENNIIKQQKSEIIKLRTKIKALKIYNSNLRAQLKNASKD